MFLLHVCKQMQLKVVVSVAFLKTTITNTDDKTLTEEEQKLYRQIIQTIILLD